MEIENLQERNQQINSIKLLYEDFFKTVASFLCNDPEILILDYMIEKSKDGELEIHDDKVPQIFKFDKNSISAAFIRLSKSKLIEIKEKSVGIVNNPQNAPMAMMMSKMGPNNLKFEKKTEKFYRLNPKLLEEFPDVLKKFKTMVEQDLSYDYVCPRCNRNYKSDEVFFTNLSLEPGKFRCNDTACSSYLHELTEVEKKASNATMHKVTEVVQIIQGKFDAILGKEWPFKKVLVDRSLLNDERRLSTAGNNGTPAGEAKPEDEEGNKESWAFKSFKSFFFEHNGVNFEFLSFVGKNRLNRCGEILKKIEEGKKKSLNGMGKGRSPLTHRKILENRKRYRGWSDFDYDREYKSLKK